MRKTRGDWGETGPFLPPPPSPFPSRARLIFALLISAFPLYYLRAWHRLRSKSLGNSSKWLSRPEMCKRQQDNQLS